MISDQWSVARTSWAVNRGSWFVGCCRSPLIPGPLISGFIVRREGEIFGNGDGDQVSGVRDQEKNELGVRLAVRFERCGIDRKQGSGIRGQGSGVREEGTGIREQVVACGLFAF